MPLTGRRIVVADDQPDELEFIAAILQDAGATVVTATNSDQALELAAAEQPDLVTLDITMPGKDTFKVVEELHLNGYRRDLRICIISGRPELRRLVLDRFSDRPLGFVDKPFDKDQLIQKVCDLLSD
jgi:CheY-like chemotaxis protein